MHLKGGQRSLCKPVHTDLTHTEGDVGCSCGGANVHQIYVAVILASDVTEDRWTDSPAALMRNLVWYGSWSISNPKKICENELVVER